MPDRARPAVADLPTGSRSGLLLMLQTMFAPGSQANVLSGSASFSDNRSGAFLTGLSGFAKIVDGVGKMESIKLGIGLSSPFVVCNHAGANDIFPAFDS